MDCRQYLDQIAADVDGVLLADERARAQAHLDRCPACRAKYQWEMTTKEVVKRNLPIHEPRPLLKQKILAHLDERRLTRFWGLSLSTHALAAAAVVLLLIVPLYSWQAGFEQPDLFSNVAISYRRATNGVSGNTPALTPAATLLDLSPWGYRLLSRRSETLDGRQGRVFVYQGQDKAYLMAQEFDGSSFPIPDRAQRVRGASRDFYTYQRDGVNLVAWQERNLLCIVAASAPESNLLALAKQIVSRG